MVINLDEVGIEPGQILADGVRQWRAECGVGQFKIGQSLMRGGKLDMEVVAAQSYYGQPFQKYPPMEWLGILFVDPDGVLSSLLLKKESRENFLELLRQLKLKRKSVLGQSIRASMSQRSGQGRDDKGNTIAVSYFAVEFELNEKPAKYSAAIADLHNTMDCNKLLTFRENAAVESKSQIIAAVRASA